MLRETSMPSAFEYVNYNMPETVPQEVVAGRQVARDMADPGIYSGGPRVTDIIHQPPRHAMLSPSEPTQRSSRSAIKSRSCDGRRREARVTAQTIRAPRPC